MTSILEDDTIDREEEQGLINGHLTSSPEGLSQAAIGKRWNLLKKSALLLTITAGCILLLFFDYGGSSTQITNGGSMRINNKASEEAALLDGGSDLFYEELGQKKEPLVNRRLPCDFSFTKVDPACPRFLHMDFVDPTGAGLGDKFFQLVVALAFAVDTHSVLITPESDMGARTRIHGDYEWVPDYFRLDLISNMTYEYVEETYKPTHVGIPGHEKYRDRIAGLNTQCNVMIDINIDSCRSGRWCYFAEEPRAYEKVRNMMGCWFLHADRSALPTLLYDPEWYNVAIHLRVGDITLLGGDAGARFFRNIKQQLDIVLDHFPVHYYFIAEDPESGNNPPKAFEFLKDIYGPFEEEKEKQEETKSGGEEEEEGAGQKEKVESGEQEEEEGGPQWKVSYLNELDVKSSIHHQMNSDVLITTGSSFALIAATISPKPIILFSKPKEGDFFGIYMRHDLAVVGDDGMIASPSLIELQALAKIRYLEVHDRVVPYDR